MRKVIVDVDSILWDFQKEFNARVRAKYPEKIFPDRAPRWASMEDLFPGAEFKNLLQIFDGMAMDQEQHEPFAGAKELLATLRDKGYRVHIASNRTPQAREALVAWLDKNDLYYDAVFAAEDKSVLFDDPSIDILIDDKPSTQEDGVQRGFLVLTLEYLYNQTVKNTYKFGTLTHMNMFLLNSVKNA